MFEFWKPTDDNFIDGCPVTITPEGEEWDPNSSQFKWNKRPYRGK